MYSRMVPAFAPPRPFYIKAEAIHPELLFFCMQLWLSEIGAKKARIELS